MIAWIDWRKRRIPNQYVVGILIAGIIGIWLFPEMPFGYRWSGFFALSVPLLMLACALPGSIGGGDIKLMAAAGVLLGITGIWNAFVTAIMSAGVYVCFLLFIKKAERKTEIALGAFICLGIALEFLKI